MPTRGVTGKTGHRTDLTSEASVGETITQQGKQTQAETIKELRWKIETESKDTGDNIRQ